MSGLVACPFCRQMFAPDEAKKCPECGLELMAMAKLPPSYDAKVEQLFEPDPPHMETLPWTFPGRGRALLVALSLVAIAVFFAPWVHETAPEIETLSGYELARHLGWIWAAAVAPLIMIPLVVTRRSVFKMRGARIAVGFLAATIAMTAGLRIHGTPVSTILHPVRVTWGWGVYASGVVGLLMLVVAPFFGGRLDDLPTKQRRRGDETLH